MIEVGVVDMRKLEGRGVLDGRTCRWMRGYVDIGEAAIASMDRSRLPAFAQVPHPSAVADGLPAFAFAPCDEMQVGSSACGSDRRFVLGPSDLVHELVKLPGGLELLVREPERLRDMNHRALGRSAIDLSDDPGDVVAIDPDLDDGAVVLKKRVGEIANLAYPHFAMLTAKPKHDRP